MRRPFNSSSSSRNPKARPPGFIPPKLSQLTARPPLTGKQRRRQLKASAWRLSRIIHAPAHMIIATLKADRSQIPVLANRTADRRGDAYRLANKIARLARRSA
ncbi:MAG TPA: hypothetical protein VFE47_03150 [Tepidisphaeraceae bacterium]|jgi:hypothetical protein|nr:hypothetical protein [Tepidisphaeraceae bacterium]